MSEANEVVERKTAEEILRQLGGRRFVAMTGAKSLLDVHGALTFRLPRAKDGINYVRITLNGSDLYDVEFWRVSMRRLEVKNVLKARVDGVYNDQLQAVFSEATGLATHL